MSELSVREAGQGEPVLLLHGLFGHGANLGALARALRERYRTLSVDLPGHGGSPAPQSFDLPGMADVLQTWLREQSLVRVHLVGHSLGGKLVMQLALTAPECVASLVVADIAPVAYAPSHDAVFAGLQAVAQAAPESRETAQALLEQHLKEAQVVQFLLSSLRKQSGGAQYNWRFDHAAIAQAYPQLLAAPQGDAPYTGPVLFIKGAASNYINESHRDAIERYFPQASLRVMADCGHWLHAEKPELFNSIVTRFLAQQHV